METEWSEDLIPVELAGTLDGLFVERVRRSPDRAAYGCYERESGNWRDLSWREMAAQIARWQDAMSREGLEPGDRVALVLRNSPEWIQFEQAALGLGLVVVPLYTDDRPDNVAYILQDAAAKLLLVQDAGRWKRLSSALAEDLPLKRVLLLEPGDGGVQPAAGDERVVNVEAWLPTEGSGLRKRGGDPHALASIVYTSGTTGRPKGVMLSHHNILSVTHASLTLIDCYQQDEFLSFLPLSHTLERSAGYYLPLMAGAKVTFSRSVAQLAEDLLITKPTALIAVPRIFERIYGRLNDQMEKKSAVARGLFKLAVSVGWRRFEYRQGRAGWHPRLLLRPLTERLVAAKVKNRLGGRMRMAVSGGAPLTGEIARVFIGLGIPIVQGYGLTETSPMVSANPPTDNEPTSVGVALRGVQVRIGENDELLVKSPGVMLGYWNNHAATRQVIDAKGWFHTGDQARIERDHIYITGRLKDILVLSNGEKVPPADMEMAIALDPLFEQVMIVGEGRSYLTALLVISGDLWPGLAREYGLDPDDPASLRQKRLLSMVQGRVSSALKDFPGYAKVRRVTLLLQPWTIDNGLLTPTLKVKRAKVLEQCAVQVEAMYTGGPAQ